MRRGDRTGSAMIEFVLGIWLFAAALGGLLLAARTAVARLRILAVADYGASLAASGIVTREEIDREMARVVGISAGTAASRWRWRTGRYDASPAARFYNLMFAEIEAPPPAFGVPLPAAMLVERVAVQAATRKEE